MRIISLKYIKSVLTMHLNNVKRKERENLFSCLTLHFPSMNWWLVRKKFAFQTWSLISNKKFQNSWESPIPPYFTVIYFAAFFYAFYKNSSKSTLFSFVLLVGSFWSEFSHLNLCALILSVFQTTFFFLVLSCYLFLIFSKLFKHLIYHTYKYMDFNKIIFFN